jgi:sigma-E factor negative regulatory protein RseA
MTDAIKEQLSAAQDGELPAAELGLLLKRVERDPELADSIGRYALIGAALRNERPVVAKGLAAKVAAALEQEAAPRPASKISPVWMKRLRPAAGIAVAAGVAAVAVLSVQQTGVQPTPITARNVAPPAVVEGIEPGIASPDATSYVVPTNASATAFVPATRLTNYVVAHSEYSSPLARRSVLTGVLAEDDGDPDVATTDGEAEPESPPPASSPDPSQSQSQ